MVGPGECWARGDARKVKATRKAERGDSAQDEKRLLMDAARVTTTSNLRAASRALSRLAAAAFPGLMREAHKPQRIRAFLESCITTSETIHPRFGEYRLRIPFSEDRVVSIRFDDLDLEPVCFIQYRLRNPFSEDRVVSIRFDDPDLELVTDAEEWRHLNRVFGVQ
ncbi:hypothetical protein T484DRAFT_1858587, partial [Baffinella frigidus]